VGLLAVGLGLEPGLGLLHRAGLDGPLGDLLVPGDVLAHPVVDGAVRGLADLAVVRGVAAATQAIDEVKDQAQDAAAEVKGQASDADA
jgi:hypothetical protein